MKHKQKRTLVQAIRWWWNTRVMAFWKVKVGGAQSRRAMASSAVVEFDREAKPLSNEKSDGITVILTAYRRAEYLAQQIKALREQTVPPEEIWVWSNQSEEDLLDVSSLADRVVVSNTNWLFWGRFSLASLVRTKYVAFFDDDILPQPQWFENCLNTIDSGFDGILGGSGVILPVEGGYSSKKKAGWNGIHSDIPVEVDLVGHAWFMKKQYVNYIWREEPTYWENGEDIHLSYLALKYGKVKTYVPPHPESDMSKWSCRPDFGKAVGRTKVATYKTTDHKDTRSKIVDLYRDNGWQLVSERGQDEQLRERDFNMELDLFNAKLENKENFSLVRFGDGEMVVINGEAIDLSEKCNGEHKYEPNREEDENKRKVLHESLLFQKDNYYVGLPCRCCVGDDNCEKLRAQSQQKEANLTWANIFVNSNYPRFIERTTEQFKGREVNVVCHEKADVSKLPFAVVKDFRVGPNAWVNDYDRVLSEMAQYIADNNINNQVFLFCAGVLSNMLIYKLAEKFPGNTYIDVGSVYDDIMGLGQTRKYLKGSKRRLKKVCVW